MTDRELLEKAAKAAGIDGEYECWTHQGFNEGIRMRLNGAKCYRAWNPLTDDGDALRLAVKLRLSVVHAPKYVAVMLLDDPSPTPTFHEDSGTDAATRRAIVRAAAAMGKEST